MHVMWVKRYFTIENSFWKNILDHLLVSFGKGLTNEDTPSCLPPRETATDESCPTPQESSERHLPLRYVFVTYESSPPLGRVLSLKNQLPSIGERAVLTTKLVLTTERGDSPTHPTRLRIVCTEMPSASPYGPH